MGSRYIRKTRTRELKQTYFTVCKVVLILVALFGIAGGPLMWAGIMIALPFILVALLVFAFLLFILPELLSHAAGKKLKSSHKFVGRVLSVISLLSLVFGGLLFMYGVGYYEQNKSYTFLQVGLLLMICGSVAGTVLYIIVNRSKIITKTRQNSSNWKIPR